MGINQWRQFFFSWTGFKANTLTALAYYGLAELSRELASTPNSVTPVWPPDGLAVGVTWLCGNGILPGVFVGSFLANIQAFWSSQSAAAFMISIVTVLGIAGGTTLGTWLGTSLLHRTIGQRFPFDRVKDVIGFLVYAGLLGPTVNATVGVAMLVIAQKVPLPAYQDVWPIWWISNVAGIFILTPLLLSWGNWLEARNQQLRWQDVTGFRWKRWAIALRRRGIESIGLAIAILLIGKASFWDQYPLAYMLIPLLICAAFRFGHLGATLSMFIISAIAILGTVRGLGTFAGPNLNQSLMGLQSFIAVVVFTSLVLVAVLAEQSQSKARLKAAFSELQAVNEILEKRTQELADNNHQLEQTLTDLRKTQAQMIQSEKMSALGNLVAGVAHEINNPIGFLRGSISNAKDYLQDIFGHLELYQQYYPTEVLPIRENAETIDLDFLSTDFPKLLDSMQLATDRIQSISTSLRTFSRTDTEHQVTANIHEGIESTLLILKYRLKANEYRPAIQIICDYGDLPLIRCFPGQLNQVFMNILANAIDMFDEMAQQSTFADLVAQPQRITIQTGLTETTVDIWMCDNGKGMSDDVKARVFDHLFTTKQVGQGTGLGLAIARQIIEEKHDGQLTVQSELGQGTEFFIQLPL